MTYLFETTATMKPHNSRKWWIDAGIIRPVRIDAASLPEALEAYREHASAAGVDISRSAIIRKNAMYVDRADGPQQIGYVITGKSEFDKGDYTGYSTQYIDLWVTIFVISSPWKEDRAA